MSQARSWTKIEAMWSQNSDNWETPDWIRDAIHTHIGPISRDPCTTHINPMHALLTNTIHDSGLEASWECPEWTEKLVYVNFPYSEAKEWCAKITTEMAKFPDHTTIGLFPARTETRWFHDNVWPHAKALVFLKGRLSFYKPIYTNGCVSPADPIGREKSSSAPFPSVLAYFGDLKHLENFEKAFKGCGKLVKLNGG